MGNVYSQPRNLIHFFHKKKDKIKLISKTKLICNKMLTIYQSIPILHETVTARTQRNLRGKKGNQKGRFREGVYLQLYT